eukprot:169170-Lingulodinium_polyedra.AAC.1
MEGTTITCADDVQTIIKDEAAMTLAKLSHDNSMESPGGGANCPLKLQVKSLSCPPGDSK